tara:strand:- start:57 stop:284 length:228 start_codon:yes stop_codon:yes gene_type:complete
MIEKSFIMVVAQSLIFARDGMNEQQISNLNPDFNKKAVEVGIQLFNYLDSLTNTKKIVQSSYKNKKEEFFKFMGY